MLLEAALAYHARGWCVIPGTWVRPDGTCICRTWADHCDRPGKHPWVKWREYEERLSTEAEIRYWWGTRPQSPVIVVTGAVTGIVVGDIDPRHGGDEAWAEWTAEHPMPRAPTSLTGGGGMHLFFKHPGASILVRNRANMLPGVDVRGDGGFVLLPPSPHPSGRTYEWSVDAHLDDVELPEIPPALLRLLRTPNHRPSANSHTPGARTMVDIEGILDGRVRIVEGERNDTMARIAGHFAHGKTPKAEVLEACLFINGEHCDPPLTAEEVERTVASIVRSEHRQKTASNGVEPLDGVVHAGPRPDDLLGAARELWAAIGVEQVTDWMLLQGAEEPQYVLVTPEVEVRLGPDLLDYPLVRRAMLSAFRLLLPVTRKVADWGHRAKALRDCAREQQVEPGRARDRTDEWLEAYEARYQHSGELPESELASAIESAPVIVGGVRHLRPVRFKAFIEAQFGEKLAPSEMRRLLTRAGWVEAHLVVGEKAIRTWQREVER